MERGRDGILAGVLALGRRLWGEAEAVTAAALLLLVGAFLGLALGAARPIQQWLTHGSRALQEHFVSEIAARSTAGGFSLRRLLLGYPAALLGSYQPVVLVALLALPALLRREAPPGSPLVAAWLVVPVLHYSLSSAQSPRYLFPTRSGNDALKFGSTISGRVPASEALPYFGTRYWGFANPILYYEERYLEPSAATAAAAVRLAEARSRWLFADRDRVAEIEAVAAVEPAFTAGDGALLEVR